MIKKSVIVSRSDHQGIKETYPYKIIPKFATTYIQIYNKGILRLRLTGFSCISIYNVQVNWSQTTDSSKSNFWSLKFCVNETILPFNVLPLIGRKRDLKNDH